MTAGPVGAKIIQIQKKDSNILLPMKDAPTMIARHRVKLVNTPFKSTRHSFEIARTVPHSSSKIRPLIGHAHEEGAFITCGVHRVNCSELSQLPRYLYFWLIHH